MIVDFDKDNHCYSVDGEIATISVTELLRKHGLAPSYKGASSKALKEKAEIGTEVHKDLENILNLKGYKPTTKQGEHFEKWVEENLDCGVGEQMIGYQHNGLTIAGTADIIGILKTGEVLIADHKNTSTFYRESVTWQVSLLDYFLRKLGTDMINGQELNWKGATKFYCFHYNPKTCEMEVKELAKVPDSELERLLDCELKGEKYQRPKLVIPKEMQLDFEKAEEELAFVELNYKLAKERAENLRSQLCKLFEEQNIKSWESPNGKLRVTYTEPVDVVSLDKDLVKKKYPMVYSECQKLTKRKASVRITNREKDEELW